MAKINRNASEGAAPDRVLLDYSDDTDDRVRAFVAALQPLGGLAVAEMFPEYSRGRALIERVAQRAKGKGDAPLAATLSPSECADVLRFISQSEPIEPENWWQDPKGAPSHLVGFIEVLQAIEKNLRANTAGRRPGDPQPPISRPARAMRSQPDSTDPDTWPTFWRVIAPGAGSYDHDMVFCETEDETKARREFSALRRADWPVRLELVRCGPLPGDHVKSLETVRAANAQNPGTKLRLTLGAWTDEGCAS
jgi:hypothetical protein